jgi:hypothetical protein
LASPKKSYLFSDRVTQLTIPPIKPRYPQGRLLRCPKPSLSCLDFSLFPFQILNSTEAIMSDDKLRILEERLTRLEASLAQRPTGAGGFTPPGGVITDPAPFPGGGQYYYPRPNPVVDPAPWPWGGGGYGRPRWPWPHPIVDPGPWPGPVVDPGPFPNPIVDQAPFAQASAASVLGRIGHVGDPAPPDFSRLSVSQLESSLHSINAERARLDSLESMVKKQLETAKKQKS